MRIMDIKKHLNTSDDNLNTAARAFKEQAAM
jgi:hypothetical protein